MRKRIISNYGICKIERCHDFALREAWGKTYYQCLNCGKSITIEEMKTKSFELRLPLEDEMLEISFD